MELKINNGVHYIIVEKTKSGNMPDSAYRFIVSNGYNRIIIVDSKEEEKLNGFIREMKNIVVDYTKYNIVILLKD